MNDQTRPASIPLSGPLSEPQNGDRPPEAAAPDLTAPAAAPAPIATSAPVLHINLDSIRRNYHALRQVAQNAACAAVVKANAYGTGLSETAALLWNEGCTTFFTATLDEAIQLRAGLGEATIYVLNSMIPGTAREYRRHGIRPVLNALADVEEWAGYCNNCGGHLPAAVHIDTGMNRLGLEAGEVDALSRRQDLLKAFKLSLVMSHLACADTPAHPKNELQLELFDTLKARLPDAPASLANSAGILLGPRYHFDLVRPGIALYGGKPLAGAENPMCPVVSLHVPILQIRKLQAGEAIGYGAAYKAKRPTRLATLPIGYADGYFRRLGGTDDNSIGPDTDKMKTHVFIKDLAAPVLGRVSMDLITVDVTDIPDRHLYRGAMVEVLGPNSSVDDLADAAGTISYEILTALSPRYRRVYIDQKAANTDDIHS